VVCFQRLILALLLLLGAGVAYGYPATNGTEYQIPGIPATKGATLPLVCSNNFYWFSGSYGSWAVVDDTAPAPYFQGKSCVLGFNGGPTPTASSYARKDYFQILTVLQCTAGGTLSGSACVCATGEVDTGTSCSNLQQQACTLANTTKADTWVTGTGAIPLPGATICLDNGCNGTFEGGIKATNNVTKVTTWEGRATYTGATCTYNPDAPNAPKPDSCPNGQTGEINGVFVCLPYNSDLNTMESTATKSTTTSGTSTSSQGGTPTSTTTTSTDKSTTTCTGSACTTTTTTTTTKGDGSSSEETKTETSTRDAHCQKNPADAVCKAAEGSRFAGSCQSGFSCSGDAAMCAIAQGVYQQKCALIDGPTTPTSEQGAYAAAKAGGTGYELDKLPISVSQANFSSANSLGVGGQCVSDLPIVVWGTSVLLPISKVCPHLATLGTIMLALSWLMAAVIVGKGVTA
jgi:hypothetical protein